MPRFSVEARAPMLAGGLQDLYVDLIDERTGVTARIGNRGASLRRLLFNYGSVDSPHLINTIFCAEDWAAKQRGQKRGLDPRGYSADIHAEAHRLRLKYPTLIEGATIDIANRTEGGIAVCQDPKTGRILSRRNFGINHPDSKSHLHGPAPYTLFEPYDINETEVAASVTYCVPIGQELGKGRKYFGDVKAYITFTLTQEGLTETGRIVNEGTINAPIAFGRHGSYRIGSEGLEDHVLRMDVKGALDVDKRLNPTGKILSREDTIFLGDEFGKATCVILDPNYHKIDTTFLLRDKDVVVYNTKRNCGIEIGGIDKYTTQCTIWNNALGEPIEMLQFDHAAVEHLVGGHAAALSMPNKRRFMGMSGSEILAKIPIELRQLVLAQGDQITYTRTYKAYKQ